MTNEEGRKNLIAEVLDIQAEKEHRREGIVDEYHYFLEEQQAEKGHDILDSFNPKQETVDILKELIHYAITSDDAIFHWEVEKKVMDELILFDQMNEEEEGSGVLGLREMQVFMMSYNFKSGMSVLNSLHMSIPYKSRIEYMIETVERVLQGKLKDISHSDLLRLQVEVKGRG